MNKDDMIELIKKDLVEFEHKMSKETSLERKQVILQNLAESLFDFFNETVKIYSEKEVEEEIRRSCINEVYSQYEWYEDTYDFIEWLKEKHAEVNE